ncbi:MAG: hypothetical protein VX265_12535 [Myxococcota bacterium]|nr:hypothetical protein [Myxococcota bacterium]
MRLASLLFFPLGMPALAGDFILETGPEVELRSSGTWARAHVVDGGWKLTFSGNGDYFINDLVKTGDGLADWALRDGTRVQLTQHGSLKDHAIKRCPDGTYLHLASANVTVPNDSAYAWRYSSDWQVIDQATIAESESARSHQDMGLYCSRLGAGAAFGGNEGPPAIVEIADDLTATVGTELPFQVRAVGSGMWVDPESELITLFYTDQRGSLHKLDMDPDLNQVGEVSRPIAEESLRAYWPQGVLRVGDYWLIAHMVRPLQTPVGGDDGNVRLLVLNDQLEIQDDATLTDNPVAEAGMRPWLTRKGDVVLMAYDRQRQHTVVEIRLDLEAFGVGAENDTGWVGSDDGGTGGGTGGDAGADGGAGDGAGVGGSGAGGGSNPDGDTASGGAALDETTGCGGCAAPGTGPIGLAAVLAALAAGRRRREG